MLDKAYADLESLRRQRSPLEVGGFVFSDAPDQIFRALSDRYLASAWAEFTTICESVRIDSTELFWGSLHPGVADVPDCRPNDPCRLIGWTGESLFHSSREQRSVIEKTLQRRSSNLAFGTSYRSAQWQIGGGDARGLRLFQAIATCDISDWSPDWLVDDSRNRSEPWVKVAIAISERNHHALHSSLQDAAQTYTSAGFQVVHIGFQRWARDHAPELDLANWRRQ